MLNMYIARYIKVFFKGLTRHAMHQESENFINSKFPFVLIIFHKSKLEGVEEGETAVNI